MLDREDTISNISSYYYVNPRKTSRVIKKLNSDYHRFKYQLRENINQVYPENMGEHLHIDEVALSKGELFTFLTNPQGRAKQGTIVAVIEGTSSTKINEVLDKIALVRRKAVKTVSLDMAGSMNLAVKASFPNAALIIDKFHVIKLVIDALQSYRIQLRWKVLKLENQRIQFCREHKYRLTIRTYPNGDTERQLLARSVHLLFKNPNDWTESQELRAHILFQNYPRLKQFYEHVQWFRKIYMEQNVNKARIKIKDWIAKSYSYREEVFHTVANTTENHMENILNYFQYKKTNAFAESFNSKIKRFRFNQRGVTDHIFFHYRLKALFA